MKPQSGAGGMRRCLALGLTLAAGLANIAWAQGSARFDGQYMGELTLTRTMSGDCTHPPLGSLYPLRVAGGEVRFVYTPRFATTLIGRIDDKGVFKASARLKNGTVQMTGLIRGNNVAAELVSPSCNYSFQTK